jgi:hypothetical protein
MADGRRRRHHADAEREYAYDRQSKASKPDEARASNWSVVDMKREWKVIFPDPAK